MSKTEENIIKPLKTHCIKVNVNNDHAIASAWYNVNVDNNETITSKPGVYVTFNVYPNKGYKIDGIIATNCINLKITDSEKGRAKNVGFTMPDGPIEINIATSEKALPIIFDYNDNNVDIITPDSKLFKDDNNNLYSFKDNLVEFNIKLYEGYQINDIKVKSSSGDIHATSVDKDGYRKLSFVMPNESVIIEIKTSIIKTNNFTYDNSSDIIFYCDKQYVIDIIPLLNCERNDEFKDTRLRAYINKPVMFMIEKSDNIKEFDNIYAVTGDHKILPHEEMINEQGNYIISFIMPPHLDVNVNINSIEITEKLYWSTSKTEGKCVLINNESTEGTSSFSFKPGEIVYVDFACDDGYGINDVKLFTPNPSGTLLDIIHVIDNRFKFIMPDKQCQVHAVIDKAEKVTFDPRTYRFNMIFEGIPNHIRLYELYDGSSNILDVNNPIFVPGYEKNMKRMHAIFEVDNGYSISCMDVKTHNGKKGITLESSWERYTKVSVEGVYYIDLYFRMPLDDVDVCIRVSNEPSDSCIGGMTITKTDYKKEDIVMDNKNIVTVDDVKENKNGVIDTFEIPDELAKELSELLTKQTIREKMLQQIIVTDISKYEEMEKILIPITAKIEAIKSSITNKWVPEQYRSENYMWNYDGYEIDGCKVQILAAK